MDTTFYPSPIWNSSFEDHDASTTLDTTLETENDSMIRCEDQRPKILTTRSSPGGPLSKGAHHHHHLHKLGGYFDDLDSFTTNAFRLNYDDALSPLEPSKKIQQRPSYLHQKISSVDTTIKETVESTQRSRRNTGFGMVVMHESDEVVQLVPSSPPAISTPPVQVSDFTSSRRGPRSHTSQGIPTHSLLGGLDAVNEDKSTNSENLNNELEKDNEQLRSQLEETRNRLNEVELQVETLTIQLEEERNRAKSISGLHSPLLALPSPSSGVNYSAHPYSPSSAGRHNHCVDVMGQNATPDSASVASLSMTPDPFSPFQRFSPYLGTHGSYASNDNSPYLGNGGFVPRSIGSAGNMEVPGTSVSSASKGINESRTDRGSKASATDLTTPSDVLVEKALGVRGQDASIALQQQLKTGSPKRKAAIVQAISPHILHLSDDKHGNFLVQRAVGVDAQIAMDLKGHFVTLSLSQFGCHVVQKILDSPTMRGIVVDELLADQVFETLTCRNSIHVWQKVLEINWTEEGKRSKIFNVVNGVMKGRWAEIAMQETGSIICQNIFESADVGEKEDCVSEILERLSECAANHWGVWVVQHIIEHGDSEHRKIAFTKLLGDAITLTLSQFGQKAIMSALKSRDPLFIDPYVDLLCDRDGSTTSGSTPATPTSPSSSRRSILVEISSAPQGIQIVTQLLTSVQPSQRDRIIKTVRKNSVFLKGSKGGLRVHQLCERARAFTGY